jgi:hypothetical protein
MKIRAIEKDSPQSVCPHNLYKEIGEGTNMLLTYILIRVWVFLAGIPGAMEILNSIEGSLENVSTSVVSSDTDTVVLDSANMVVMEMASLALPA